MPLADITNNNKNNWGHHESNSDNNPHDNFCSA